MPYPTITQALLATTTSQLLAFWPGSLCTARCTQLQFCKFYCPLRWALKLQYEYSTGTKIFLHLLLIKHQCHATSFQPNHNVFVMYFHSGMRLSQVFHILFFHKIKQSPSTDVFMLIQFCADTNFNKFFSSCDDCLAFKRMYYLNQFICSSPVHKLFFFCQYTVNDSYNYM
jgi:hypothetical protein